MPPPPPPPPPPSSHASFPGVGRSARAGGAVDDVRIGASPRQVVRLSSYNQHADSPGLIQVTLFCRRPLRANGGGGGGPNNNNPPPQPQPPPLLNATFGLYADLYWVTAKGQASATIDIPAGGAIVTVGGADGIEVNVGAEGTDTSVSVRVEGMASWVQSGHPRPAQRTTFVRVADGLAQSQLIPGYARAARAYFPRNDDAQNPLSLRMHARADGGGPVLAQSSPLVPGEALGVPAGAEGFSLQAPDPQKWADLVGAADPALSSEAVIPVVWELSL